MTQPDDSCPHVPWYRQPPWIVLLLILFFPVGLFLMWRYAAWQERTKRIVTSLWIWPMATWWLWRSGRSRWEIGFASFAGLVWLVIVVGLFSGGGGEESNPPETVQELPEATATASASPAASAAATLSQTAIPASTSATPTSSETPIAPTVTGADTRGPTATPAPISAASSAVPRLVIAAVSAGLPSYDRDDWQHWIDTDGDCQNARAEVLIAESTAAVTFTSASGGCTVATGLWVGPFTGQTFTAASDVDVDHMVPLKNAHDSGAWSWSAARKRDYANDLSDPQHLIAVDDGTNQSKGARGPEEWKPPLQSYWCQYAVDWIGIKRSWDLTATAAEWDALVLMLSTCPGGSPTVVPSAPPTTAPKPAPTVVATPTPTLAPTATATQAASCDPSYPDVCIDPYPPDLNCGDIPFKRFKVLPPDPHGFDGDNDGIGCES